MSLIGLDLNATRARAMRGPANAPPQAQALTDTTRDLPLVLSLEGRTPVVGHAGSALRRRLPHLVCENFLTRLGTPHQWTAGRHRLDAAGALALVFDRLRSVCTSAQGAVLAVPPYLTRDQGETLTPLAVKSRFPLLGSVSAALASALSAYRSSPWTGPAVVIDADDHALTCSLLSPGSDEKESQPSGTFAFRQAGLLTLPPLSLRAWKIRLIDMLADRCILHSRWDPRDSGESEQMLYDQLEEVWDACRQEQMAEVVARGAQWCQNLILRPEEIRTFCDPLIRKALEQVREFLASAGTEDSPKVLASAAVCRLPGLREALQEETGGSFHPLPADAAAAGAHELAACFQRGELPRGHHDAMVCRPPSAPPKCQTPERKRRIFRFK